MRLGGPWLALSSALWLSSSLAVAQDATPSGEDGEDGEGAETDPEAARRDREAREAYEAGAVSFEEGRYSVALDFFQQSYALSGRPTLLYNIGLSLDRLRRDREALDAFERYLDAEPESEHRRQVSARIASLRAALAAEEEERAREEREREARDRALVAEANGEAGGGSVFEAWWFWTIVGVLVAGGAATAIVLATSGDQVEEPLRGTNGAVFATLSFGP
jgi:tetratricopeptide (TPR) repeat protein